MDDGFARAQWEYDSAQPRETVEPPLCTMVSLMEEMIGCALAHRAERIFYEEE